MPDLALVKSASSMARFAGYATQRFDDPTVGDTSIPVVGGRLSWYPTRFLTHTFTADRTFASSDFSNNGVLLGSVTNTGTGLLPGSLVTSTTANLNGDWDVNRFFAFPGPSPISVWSI